MFFIYMTSSIINYMSDLDGPRIPTNTFRSAHERKSPETVIAEDESLAFFCKKVRDLEYKLSELELRQKVLVLSEEEKNKLNQDIEETRSSLESFTKTREGRKKYLEDLLRKK